jgi:hypothetical protein
MPVETISIKSGKLELVSSTEDIKLNSNTYIHLGVKEGLYIDVGSVDGDNTQNKVWINSPSIHFGKANAVDKLEPVVKGYQLELILNEILDLLNQVVSTPGAYVPQGQAILKTVTQARTEIIKQKMSRFQSNITRTV